MYAGGKRQVNKRFTDNRAAEILQILGHKSGVTVASMAQKLSVSERTIRNDIRQLNEDLGGSAAVEGNQGRYSLRIFDPEQYKRAFEKICNIDGLFGTPRGRLHLLCPKKVLIRWTAGQATIRLRSLAAMAATAAP